MNGFIRAALASVFALVSSTVFGQQVLQQSVVAEYVTQDVSIITPRGHVTALSELHYPGADFVKVHFEHFRPPPGMVIEVRNPSGTESYLYSRDFRDSFTYDANQGDDGEHSFYAMSISGETAVIEVHSNRGLKRSFERASAPRVSVDHVVRGFGLHENSPDVQSGGKSKSKGDYSLAASGSGIQSTCGVMERYDAVCWAGSDPEAYDRSRPVAKIIVGIKSCSAWRVGPDNHMFTNNHCAASKTEVSAMEVWFNYERSTCLGDETETVVKVSGDSLIATDYTLDYTLFSVTDFSAIESFGNLGLEVREANLGEVIYIPQHGSGDPKQIAIDSDMNVSGVCQVDADDYYGRAEGTDIGYYCDTIGGSSGAPVVLADTHKAVALHHTGGCLNSGVKMSLIWNDISRHFGRVVPEGDFDPSNLNLPPEDPNPTPDPDPATDEPPVAAFNFSCVYLECGFDGSGSSDPEGTLTGLNWNFGDESTDEGVTVSHAFPSAGTYSVTLTVTDLSGNIDSLTKNVSVVEDRVQNSAPSAEFSMVCDNLDCVFNGDASSDVDGSIVSYAWSFGDGASGNGVEVTHGYTSEGTFAVTLTVTDDGGATNSFTGNVTVQAAVVDPATIELSAQGFKVKGQKWAELAWNGAVSDQVRIIRDDVELAVTENSGTYSDASLDNPTKSAVYQVCELDGAACSEKVEVTF